MSEEMEQSALPNSATEQGNADTHNEVELELDTANPDGDSSDHEEEEEIEIGDKKFSLPKSASEKLKAERLMHADYTRKTQELAKEREADNAKREESKAKEKDFEKYIDEIAKVKSLDERISQYNQLNWAQLIDSDPIQALKLQQEHRELQGQREEAGKAVTQKQQQYALSEQQEIAKQVQEANAYFVREIPGWSQDRDNQVTKFATDLGVPAKALAEMVLKNPQLAKILHQAELYDQLVKKQAAKPKPEVQDKPVTRVSAARPAATNDPSKMTDKQFADWRKAQIKNRK